MKVCEYKGNFILYKGVLDEYYEAFQTLSRFPFSSEDGSISTSAVTCSGLSFPLIAFTSISNRANLLKVYMVAFVLNC